MSEVTTASATYRITGDDRLKKCFSKKRSREPLHGESYACFVVRAAQPR